MPVYRHEPLELRDVVRQTFVGAGLTEVVTMALVAPRMVERFPARDDGELADEPEQRAAGRPITVTNPLSSQHSVLRQSLIGSLLEVVATNLRHGRDDVAIFEVGKGYGALNGSATHEWWRLGIALTGAAEPPAWTASPGRTTSTTRKVSSIAVPPARLPDARLRAADRRPEPPSRPIRTCPRRRDVVGRVGELHPTAVEALDLRPTGSSSPSSPSAGLAAGRPATPRVFSPSRHPSVERDLAVIVTEDRAAADVQDSIRRRGGPLLRQVVLFDVYRGKPLDRSEKSLAWRLTFAGDDRTLTEAEVDDAVAAITAGLGVDVAGRLRT